MIKSLVTMINTAMPYAWDDSMSTYEFMGKIVSKINELINFVNVEIVDEVIEKLDMKVQEYTTSELNTMLETGALSNLIAEYIISISPFQTELVSARSSFANLSDRLVSMDQGTHALHSTIHSGMIAHRGLQSLAPENTLKAIRKAGEYGFAMVEIDPRKTLDNQWVVIHDDTVDRTTNGTGYVSDLTSTQIAALIIDSPSALIDPDEVIKVPSLDAALAEIAAFGMGANMDGSKITFNQTNLSEIRDALAKYNLLGKSFIMCPTVQDRQAVQLYAPDLRVGWVSVPSNSYADLAEAVNYPNPIVAYEADVFTSSVQEQFHDAGVDVMIYYANTISDVYLWKNAGVRYIETDLIIPGGKY